MKTRIIKIVSLLVIYLTGIVLLGVYAGWEIMLGVFLMQWGNNVKNL